MVIVHSAIFNNKRIIFQGETIKLIFHGDVAATTTGISAHNLTGGNYQVPSGKTFTILGVRWFNAGGRKLTIYEADTADSTTGEVDKFSTEDGLASDNFQDIATPYLPVIPASHFCNLKTSNASSSWRNVYIYGVELN